jgi:segregation and condensation protein A
MSTEARSRKQSDWDAEPPGDGDGNGHGQVASLSVKLDIFEGPLDLLLFLIRKDEIDITDIPIAKITAEYLGLLRLMEECDLEIAGEYLVMAATLLRIKSAMLLPRDPDADEEEDPREELVQALLEYRKFKEGAAVLQTHEADERQIFARTDFVSGPPPVKSRFVVDSSLWALLSAFHDVVARIEPDTVHRVAIAEQTVEERIAELEELFASRDSWEFTTLFAGLAARWLIIVTFLAILEMVRTRRITLRQARPFGEIVLQRTAESVVIP